MNRVCLSALAALAGLAIAPAAVADDYATIKGQVVLSAPPPAADVVVTADKEHCEAKGKLKSDVVVVDAASKGLKNVVVWLRPDTDDRAAKFPQDKIKPELKTVAPKHHVVDQPCCQFVPRIVAARAGDTLEIKNSAPVNHNINYGGEGAFNVNLPPGQSKKLDNPLTASNIVPFKCDIHPWMAGKLRVYDHPYFALTGPDGKFEIPGAPAGKWRLVVWHEEGFHKGRAGFLGTPITVAGPVTDVPVIDFEFPKK